MEKALSSMGVSFLRVAWEELEAAVKIADVGLAIVWPARRSGMPGFPPEALGSLLGKCSVLALLRHGDGDLMEALRGTSAWILHEESEPKTVQAVADRLLREGHKN